MKKTLVDREFSKFRDGNSGDAVAVTHDGGPVPTEPSGVDWDEIVTSFPDVHQELYTYKLNSETVQTVLVSYQSESKKTILYMQRTRF
jgi:hypothetical protein